MTPWMEFLEVRDKISWHLASSYSIRVNICKSWKSLKFCILKRKKILSNNPLLMHQNLRQNLLRILFSLTNILPVKISVVFTPRCNNFVSSTFFNVWVKIGRKSVRSKQSRKSSTAGWDSGNPIIMFHNWSIRAFV